MLHLNTTNLDGDAFIALLALPNLHRYYASVGEADLRAVDRIRGDSRLIDFLLDRLRASADPAAGVGVRGQVTSSGGVRLVVGGEGAASGD